MTIKFIARFSQSGQPILTELSVICESPGRILAGTRRPLLGNWRPPSGFNKKSRHLFDTKQEATDWLISELTARYEAEIKKVRDV